MPRIYSSAGVSGPYTVIATPVGGNPIKVTCPTPNCPLTGLKPGTTYSVTAVGSNPTTGKSTAPSPPISITTPGAGAPALVATVSGPSVSVDISPSTSGETGPYTLVATPIGGGQPITVTCSMPYDCSLTGLAPGTTYDVTATATTASGQPTAASAPTTITVPLARSVHELLCRGAD